MIYIRNRALKEKRFEILNYEYKHSYFRNKQINETVSRNIEVNRGEAFCHLLFFQNILLKSAYKIVTWFMQIRATQSFGGKIGSNKIL